VHHAAEYRVWVERGEGERPGPQTPAALAGRCASLADARRREAAARDAVEAGVSDGQRLGGPGRRAATPPSYGAAENRHRPEKIAFTFSALRSLAPPRARGAARQAAAAARPVAPATPVVAEAPPPPETSR